MKILSAQAAVGLISTTAMGLVLACSSGTESSNESGDDQTQSDASGEEDQNTGDDDATTGGENGDDGGAGDGDGDDGRDQATGDGDTGSGGGENSDTGSGGMDDGGIDDGGNGTGGEQLCPPCAPPPNETCVGTGICGCGPYECKDEGLGEPCGNVTCEVGMVCCNSLQSICTEPNGVCLF